MDGFGAVVYLSQCVEEEVAHVCRHAKALCKDRGEEHDYSVEARLGVIVKSGSVRTG